MDRAADAGDNEQHHQAERVELEPEVHVQIADGEPVKRRLTTSETVYLDENQRKDEARDYRTYG